ncbi:MAG: helix-turn-helix domain-containing protein, partial [Gemmatimonadota bacterium]
AHDPVAVLSPRELETLRFLACGLTNREIATRLGISVKTVETQMGRALKSLRVSLASYRGG